MKHPEELDLHDLDKLRIAELEATITELTFDLEAAQDRISELDNQLSQCEVDLEDVTIQRDNCEENS